MNLAERIRMAQEANRTDTTVQAEPLGMLDGSDPAALAAEYKSGERTGPSLHQDAPELVEESSTDTTVAPDTVEATGPALLSVERKQLSVEHAMLRKKLNIIRDVTYKLPEDATPEERFSAVANALTAANIPFETKPGKFWAVRREEQARLKEINDLLQNPRARQTAEITPVTAPATTEATTPPAPAVDEAAIAPVYLDAEDAYNRVAQEKHDRHVARGHAAIADLVKFDANYMGHQDRNVSGRRAGAFMSSYELDQIAAHQDLIRDNLDERRAEFAQHRATQAAAELPIYREPTPVAPLPGTNEIMSRARRTRISLGDIVRHPGAYLSSRMDVAYASWKARTPEQKKRFAIGGGIILGAVALTGLALSIKYGIDHSSVMQPDAGADAPKNEFGIDFSKASKEALKIHKGEGIYETFKELGIPKAKWHEALQEYGPKLVKKGLAYRDESIGGFGWNKAMKLTVKQLESVFNK